MPKAQYSPGRKETGSGTRSHIGWPQTAPVISAIIVITAPIGAAAFAASAETWWRRISQINEVTNIITQILIAIIAAGTCT